MITELADIHCHILPYVDDGAEHFEETEKLLAADVEQGISVVCATPHLRHGMFESTDDAVVRQYERTREYIETCELPVRLLLGREYYCDQHFMKLLEADKLIRLGEGSVVLTEFSSRYSFEKIRGYVERILETGLTPLVAHVERYPSVAVDTALVAELRGLGARIQINAGSVLGREGHTQKKFCYKLMRLGLVDAVASDAHDPEFRPQELLSCAKKIERKMGGEYAAEVMRTRPLEILNIQDKGEI